MTKLKTQPCAGCSGSGVVPADDVGQVLRTEREKLGITGRAVADKLSISDSYLFDLERGSRRWTTELVNSYQSALEALSDGN